MARPPETAAEYSGSAAGPVTGAWTGRLARGAGVTRTIGKETSRSPWPGAAPHNRANRRGACSVCACVCAYTDTRAISLIYQTLYTDSSFQKYSICRVILLSLRPAQRTGARLHV